MSIIKPAIPKGTRDFGPSEMARRNYIFDTIGAVFIKYGYLEIQTPAMESLDTLTGKYGEEGDKLIFKILNSGDFLSKVQPGQLTAGNSQLITPIISEKALRYDLTVPFARYVVMHQNEITFPFKRFQIQPVWRADRPQRGRYREFYQCDADVVGSASLLNEAEFVMIYREALSRLGLKDFSIKLNNRKILAGIAEIIGKHSLIVDMTVAIDKLDKIGFDGVTKELTGRGFTPADIEQLKPVILLQGSNQAKLERLREVLKDSRVGLQGLEEIESIFAYVKKLTTSNSQLPTPHSQLSTPNSQPPTPNSPLPTNLQFDITLARGLNYYTGAIFEVKSNEVSIGSIGGGGRYDDLTGMFGLKGLTGAGISFGADRIYDVMEELNLFPDSSEQTTRVLISNFDAQSEQYALPLLQQLRNEGIAAELYPEASKLKKQMAFADNKKIPFVILAGSEEMNSGSLTLKDMQSGTQERLSFEDIIDRLR